MSWNHQDWLLFAQAVVSATAIVGAFSVAFYQHFLEHGRKRVNDLKRAKIVASAVTMKSAWYRGIVKQAFERMQAATEGDCDPKEFSYQAKRLESLSIWSIEEIVSLEALPNNCAHNLAAGLDRVETARLLMVDFSEGADRVLSAHRKLVAGRIAFILNEADKMLVAAVQECQKASFGAVHASMMSS